MILLKKDNITVLWLRTKTPLIINTTTDKTRSFTKNLLLFGIIIIDMTPPPFFQCPAWAIG